MTLILNIDVASLRSELKHHSDNASVALERFRLSTRLVSRVKNKPGMRAERELADSNRGTALEDITAALERIGQIVELLSPRDTPATNLLG